MNDKLVVELYSKYGRELQAYILSLCHNAEEAEDVLQEVWVKAMLSLPKDCSNVRAWLYTVARNEYFRRYNRNKTGLRIMEEMKRDFRESELSRDEAAEQERRLLLRKAIDQLDDRLKEIMVLQYYRGYSQKQIAEIMKLSPENVRVLAHRAKKRIKEYMENER